MYTGLQKARLILSLLEDKAGAILAELNSSSASLLMDAVEDLPKQTDDQMKTLLIEFHENLAKVQQDPVSSFDMDYLEPVAPAGYDISSEVEEAIGESLSPTDEVITPNRELYFQKPERVVDLLRDQDPQVSAFIYNRMEPAVQSELKEHFSVDEINAFEQEEFEELPLSARVFDNMLESLKVESETVQEDNLDDLEDSIDLSDSGKKETKSEINADDNDDLSLDDDDDLSGPMLNENQDGRAFVDDEDDFLETDFSTDMETATEDQDEEDMYLKRLSGERADFETIEL